MKNRKQLKKYDDEQWGNKLRIMMMKNRKQLKKYDDEQWGNN